MSAGEDHTGDEGSPTLELGEVPARRRPGGLSPGARVLLSAAALVIVLAGLRSATRLLLPVVLAVFVAIMVVPLFRRLRGSGLPIWVALVSVLVTVLAGLGGFAMLVVVSAQDLLRTVAEHSDRLVALRDELVGTLVGLGVAVGPQEWTGGIEPGPLLMHAGSLAGGLLSLASQLLFVTVMVGFMLAELHGLGAKLDAAFGVEAARGRQIARAVARVRRYVWIKTVISVATGVAAGLSCWLAGLETPLVWGVLAFGLNYIPVFGSAIAAVPPVALALIQGWLPALLLGLAYLAINIVIANIIEPRVVGQRLGLSPAVVLLSLLFWGWVFGAIGMLLAVPFTMIARSVCDYHERLRWLATLLSSGAELERRRRTRASPRGEPSREMAASEADFPG